MADLLRSGNTMLNMACPVCSNPIFRNRDGKTFCPTCNRDVKVVKSRPHQDNVIKSEPNIKEQEKGYHYDKQNELINSLEEVLLEKIEIITNKLKNENHLQLIETYTNILINCFEILNTIQSKR